MTAPKPMTRRELIELAALDALGLLDDYEASLYTRSFHHAPAPVQDELIELQAKIATDPVLLSDEEPSRDLRERVLDFVNREVEQSASELMPLATIGRGRAAASAALVPQDDRDIAGRIGGIGWSAPVWRVAAFVLCGVVIVMGYFLSDTIRNHNTLAQLALSKNTDARLEQMIGPTVKDYIFDHTSMRIVLATPEAPHVGRAVLFFYEGATEGLLVMELPRSDGDVYELSVVDANGLAHRVARFASEGGVNGVKVAGNALALAAGSTFQITGPEGLILVSA